MLNKLKKLFYKSEENRIQFFNIFGFIILPIATLLILYIIAMVFIPHN